MGVGPGEGYGTSVIDFGYEAFGEEAVGHSEGGGNNVGKGFDYVLGLGVRGERGEDGEERTGGIWQRGDLFNGVVLFSRDFWCRGLRGFFGSGALSGAGRLCIGGAVLRLVIRVEGGRGERQHVIFGSSKSLSFPGVGDSLGVEFGVTEHLA